MRRKILVIFLLLSIVFSCTTPINAQQVDPNNSLSVLSDSLNKLGLLAGDGRGNYNLDKTLKRTEATTFIAKLMGKYEYIQNNKDTFKKTKFKDVSENDWFAPYVGFCYSNKIIAGYSNEIFGVKDNTTEQAFFVMLLKLLNYSDLKWNDNVFKKAYEVGIVSDKAYLSRTKDNNNSFTRGKAISSMNSALNIKINNQNMTLIQSLIKEGAVNADLAKSLGYEVDSKADIAIDTSTVKINEILVVNSTQITIELNTELKSISKNNILIYESANKNNILSISSVTTSGTKLTITTSNQESGNNYNVELINIKDSKDNILTGITGSFSGYAQILMPPVGFFSPSSPTNDSSFVKSVTTINTNQIKIVFDEIMDRPSAENISFYEIKDKGTDTITLTTGAIKLNLDTVIITLNNNDRLTNNTTANVTIKKGIKTFRNSELTSDIKFDVSVNDISNPTFRSFEVTGEKALKITFSEPVCDGTYNSILDVKNFDVEHYKPKYFNDLPGIAVYRDFSYTIQRAELSSDSITLFFEENLEEGKISVEFNSAGTEIPNSIQDYAGNRVIKNTIFFNHIENGSKFSEVTVKNATENFVTLAFSKPVTAKDLKLFHTDKNVEANMSIPVSIDSGDFVREITFDFPTKIPTGETNFFLVNSSEPSRKMFNIYGEYIADQTLVAEVAVDKEPPYIKTVKIDAISCTLEFNEKVNTSFATNPDNYDIYTSYNPEHVTLTPELKSDKTVRINISKKFRDNTAYTLNVRNAEDIYGNIKSSEIEFNFTTGDSADPIVEEDRCCTINSEGKIIIYFSEPMNETQMLDASNYKVATTPGAIYVELGTEDKVVKLSNMSVMLDLNTEVDLPNVKVKPIQDLAGKYLYITSAYQIKQDVVNIKFADLISKNKVKITFSTKLKTFSTSDISFTGITDSAIRINYMIYSMQINDEGNTEIVMVLDKDLSTDGKYQGSNIVAIIKSQPTSESIFGTRLTPSQTISINDKAAPEVITYNHDSNSLTEPVEKVILSGDILTSMVNGKVAKDTTGAITISYSEEIPLNSISILTYVVEGYTVTNVSHGNDSSELVLSIKANSDNTPARTTVTQAYNICDTANNTLESGKIMIVR